jgi:hypothetical protein
VNEGVKRWWVKRWYPAFAHFGWPLFGGILVETNHRDSFARQ